MLKRIAVFAIIALAVIAASAAYAQRQGGAGQDQPRNGRIVKGTIESISDGKVTVAVESIFIPREGEMKDAPKRLTVAINDNTRFVTKEGGRDAKRSDFKKGDEVVLMTEYEKDEYTLRAMMTPDVAAAMRKQLGEKMRQRGNTGQAGQGQRGMGMNGPNAMGADRQRQPVFVATYDGRTKDTVKLTLTGIIKPSAGGTPKVEALPQKKTVEVSIGDRTRLFLNGEKASIREFKKGDQVIVMIPRANEKGAEPMLMLMADKESAGKLREMMRDRIQERRNGRRQQK